MVPSDFQSRFAVHFFQAATDGMWVAEFPTGIPVLSISRLSLDEFLGAAELRFWNPSFQTLVDRATLGDEPQDLSGWELRRLAIVFGFAKGWDLEKFANNGLFWEKKNCQSNVEHGKKVFSHCSIQGEVESGSLVRIFGVVKDLGSTRVTEERLDRLLRMEGLVGTISHKLLRVVPENHRPEITECLGFVGESSYLDRVYIYELNHTGTHLSNTYEWCASGIDPVQSIMQNIPVWECLGDSWTRLENEQAIVLQKEDSQPNSSQRDHSHFERELLLKQNVKSILIISIRQNRKMVGFIGFDSVREGKQWSREDVDMLGIFADLLSLSLENISNQRELKAKEITLSEFYSRINEDLDSARITQSHLISQRFPVSQHYRFTSYVRPKETVGGDVLHYLQQENCIDVLFGDVSGHGISSAMVSGMVVLSFKMSSKQGVLPSQNLDRMNRDLKDVILNHHISAALTRYYPESHRFLYSYAGHPPLVLVRDGKIRELDGMNTPLLAVDHVDYFDNEIVLEPHDRILYYSDGFFEVFNQYKEFLGLHSFFQILEEIAPLEDPETMIEVLTMKIMNYCCGDIRDDLTILVMDVH